jgi:hypothetical protein
VRITKFRCQNRQPHARNLNQRSPNHEAEVLMTAARRFRRSPKNGDVSLGYDVINSTTVLRDKTVKIYSWQFGEFTFSTKTRLQEAWSHKRSGTRSLQILFLNTTLPQLPYSDNSILTTQIMVSSMTSWSMIINQERQVRRRGAFEVAYWSSMRGMRDRILIKSKYFSSELASWCYFTL